MTRSTHVAIGVPVLRGETYLEETLRAIQAQTHLDFEVVISLDGPQPSAEPICRPFLADSRFRLVTQPEHLGWVGHVNRLMSQVQAPFWYLNPQDDIVEPNYLSTLLAHAQQFPEAAVVYCDIQAFGLETGRLVQASVDGSPLARQLTLLHDHLAAVAFRGLTRIEALQHAGELRGNEVDEYCTDTVWMAAMARWGPLQRVPVALYHKRYHPDNTYTRWLAWPAEKMTRAWLIHCARMLENAMLVPASTPERRLIWLAAVERLISPQLRPVRQPAGTSRQAFTESLLTSFFDYLKSVDFMDISALLQAPWNLIEDWTRSWMLTNAHREGQRRNHVRDSSPESTGDSTPKGPPEHRT